MKRESLVHLTVFVLLVALGVGTRWISGEYEEFSNFTAVGATALFAGFYFANPLVGLIMPLVVMAISNFTLKAYDNWQQMSLVYCSLLLPVLAGMLLRRRFAVWRVPAYAVAQAAVFFVVTNFAFWAFYDLYPKNAAGLIEGYVAGLPFFGRTLAGDLLFAGIIFGTYALAVKSGTVPRVETPREELQPAAVPVR